MKVVVVCNSRSGRGRAERLAEASCAAVAGRGWKAARLRLDAERSERDAALAGAAAAIVVGGDGTIRSFAARAEGSGVPIAIAPAGTENLAARQFGFGRNLDALIDAIAHGRTRTVDLGTVRASGGREHRFVIMLSAGLDADVVHDLDGRRRGPIGRSSYLLPMARSAMRWAPSRVSIRPVDGPGAAARGQLLVANAPAYALGLDPVRGALPDDGALDARILAARGWTSLVAWALRLWLGTGSPAGCPSGRSGSWQVGFDRPTLLQADGDPVPFGAVDSVEVAAVPGALTLVDMRP